MFRRLRNLFHKTQVERDLDREVHFHLDKETEKYIALGFTPDEARHRARAVFGSVDVTKEAHRDGRGTRWIEETAADVRHALRTLRLNPAMAGAAIITLALAIGANTAIFSAVDTVLLRPLPFTEPDRLVTIWETNPDRGWTAANAAPANVFDWRERVKSFESVAAYARFSNPVTLTGYGEPQHIVTAQVTGDFFDVLGVRAVAGETFRDAETWRSDEVVAVISHRLWRGTFAADPGIAGKLVTLNGRDVRIRGVLPANFSIPGIEADIWRPFAFDPAQRTAVQFRRGHWLNPVARLKPGVTLEQANADLQRVASDLEREYPETNTRMGAGMSVLQENWVGGSRRSLLVLLGAVGVLLLIACANVGNLLLVHASKRSREVALRLALGARRTRLIRQAFTESLVLSALGGAAGLALGWWGTRLLAAMKPAELLPMKDIPMSWTVIGYVAAITTLSGLVFGLAPVLSNRERTPGDALRAGVRGGRSTRHRRWSEALVVGEIALALFLATGAGLLAKSLWKLERADSGLDTRGVWTASITLPGIRYDSISKVNGFWDEVARRVRGISGVTHAATVSQLPLTALSWSGDFTVEGWPAEKFGVELIHRDVSPEYFKVMGVPLKAGRAFDERDIYGAEPVVIINDVVARQYFEGVDPIGKRVVFDRVPSATPTWRTIVGVVGSERQGGLAAPPTLEMFQPIPQRVPGTAVLVARTTNDARSLTPAIRAAVSSLDPLLALASIRTMDDVRAQSAARARFLTTLLVAFAAVGLILAMVGVYGVMATVARLRTREIGIRIALGAGGGHVRWLVVGRGLALTVLGVAGGVVASLVGARALRALLYDVQPIDPLTFAVMPLALGGAALLACWLPAARASRVDPVGALRAD